MTTHRARSVRHQGGLSVAAYTPPLCCTRSQICVDLVAGARHECCSPLVTACIGFVLAHVLVFSIIAIALVDPTSAGVVTETAKFCIATRYVVQTITSCFRRINAIKCVCLLPKL